MPATMSSRENEKKDTVIVNQVIPYMEDDEPIRVSYPNLVATSSKTHGDALNSMKLLPVKRRRQDSSTEADEDEWELLGKSGGREWQGRRAFEQMNIDYFVGVRRKQARTVKLIEVDRSFCLRPAIGHSDWADDSEDEEEDEEAEKHSYVDRRKKLLDTFGGKKSKRRIARYERDRITEKRLGQNAAAEVQAAAKEMKSRDEKQGINQVAIDTTEWWAPPHDNAALRPENAYPLEGLTTPKEMASLEIEAEKVLHGAKNPESFENPGWHPLVWELLLNTAVMPGVSREEKINRLKAGVYLHYLIVLARSPENIQFRTQQQLMTDMGVFPPILDCLLDRFTIADSRESVGKGKRIRRREDLTRILSFAVIMWITALGFRDCRRIGELAEALGVQEARALLRQGESLGCKVKKAKGQRGAHAYSLSLPVPLKFPPMRKRLGKPKGRQMY